MFSQYKLLFNNTSTVTRYNHQPGVPYTLPRGGFLTFIHNQYAYPNNITKIPTNPTFSPYLQIIKILNSPLTPFLILHLYMPSYHNDLYLIPHIMETIAQQIHNNSNAHIILCGGFNRDIALIGYTEDSTIHPSQQTDH